MIVDDHEVWRGALRDLLFIFDNMEFAGEASNGEDAIRLCEELDPDVVLMDMVMPEMDGVTATRAIRRACPNTRLIALTSDESMARAALQAGASGYLLKGVSIDVLARAIESAYAGNTL